MRLNEEEFKLVDLEAVIKRIKSKDCKEDEAPDMMVFRVRNKMALKYDEDCWN